MGPEVSSQVGGKVGAKPVRGEASGKDGKAACLGSGLGILLGYMTSVGSSQGCGTITSQCGELGLIYGRYS